MLKCLKCGNNESFNAVVVHNSMEASVVIANDYWITDVLEYRRGEIDQFEDITCRKCGAEIEDTDD